MTGSKKRILLVEDEPHLAFNLEYNLRAENFEVIPAIDGVAASAKFESDGPFDLIVLDIMIPEINGFEVAKRIRLKDQRTGILMLTARASEEDVIAGLETGADDYMTKPFHLKEFILRVKRMAQRSELFPRDDEAEGSHILAMGPIRLDTEALELRTSQGQFHVTALESSVLQEFMRNPSRVLSREFLLARVWGIKSTVETRTVDNFIMRLRKYIEADPSHPVFLESVRGRGYRFVCPDDGKKD